MAREPIKREPITFSRLTKEELKLEAALQREEVALGLRNANGSTPPSPAFPKIQSEERRLRLSAKTDRYGEQLANWLNASQRNTENHRVCKVIECLQATSASVTKAYWPTSVMVGGQVFSGRMPRELMLRGGQRLAAMLGKRPRPPLCQEVLLCYMNDVSKLSRSLSRASSQTYGKGGGRTAGYTER